MFISINKGSVFQGSVGEFEKLFPNLYYSSFTENQKIEVIKTWCDEKNYELEVLDNLSLYDANYRAINAHLEINEKFCAFIECMFKEYSDKGYSPLEISHIMFCAISGVQNRFIINLRRIK